MLPHSKSSEYFGGMLTAILELMHTYGIPLDVATRETQHAVARGYRIKVRDGGRQIPPISRYAEVCSRWHFDRQFLDARGNLRPLSWDGKSGSLLKLVSQVVGKEHSRAVARQLVSRKLLKKSACGGWLPKSKVVAPAGLDNAQIIRASNMIGRLLRTVTHNTELKYRGEVLLEVMSQVPRLPSRHIPEFKRITKAQGLIFAKTVDDWLEARNLKPSKRVRKSRCKEAGVVAFAFHEPSFR